MSGNKKIKLVLCWHMHQPEYRDRQTGEFQLPWTYLHVIKDYVDMVAHLENEPDAKAVVNFAPILLEQIEDYAKQLNCYLHDGVEIKDTLLSALVMPAYPLDAEERLELINNCLRANRERQIDRYPAFSHLVHMAEWVQGHGDAPKYINCQFIADMLVWYHLIWMGETVKLSDARIQRLIAKGSNYTLHERIEIVEVIEELLSKVILRYKTLAQAGRIELSVTPYAHPILPLMLDIKSAHEAMPDAPLPVLDSYPGGKERVNWHIEQGIATFKRFFDFTPQGCWPSEGAVSEATLKVIGEAGFTWAATGGQVLLNSFSISDTDHSSEIHHPFQVDGTDIPCFFRDDGLSDLIGFNYSKWHADDAVNDMIQHLENIAEHEAEGSVVSIIMDGENAWEYFPDNGYHFLSAFYKGLAEHPDIELTTFSECLAQKVEIKPLDKLMAGSWVYGTFSTWIGDIDKNRAWDMLGDAKNCFDKVLQRGRLSKSQLKEAELQLAVCEGSDWFWWFGDYNPGEAVSSFEKQFRLNLSNLYCLLGEEPPAYLSLSFTQGSGDPAMGGTMRKGTD
ncbi:glycoside hydrolase [Methylococcaceae bacterium CS1]|nr:glycoside hydrolase [Methyloprofundus sp.]TXK99223.1 glycoside hydrolase [Methylococcaceae bacterium CS4]TXL00185.1 glycoside hydrolase [Methylococcaceae bacterium CS5]TXL08433.1 glycoside hydrolase [Methylococcaceae bacterium CS1]TXL09407.1 glycoside hydrolase [Methylococcaceae bacterium CS3]TXL11972.1 glycoside hydrolase [Methylococcaceae bacterium CS2]